MLSFLTCFGVVNIVVVQAQPVTDHICTDFNAGLMSWGAQNVGVTSNVRTPPATADKYIHCHDDSGPSFVYGPAPYLGDWRVAARCGRTLCYDVRLFIDGLSTSNNYSIGLRLISGNPSAPNAVAYYNPTISMSEDPSANQGWHRVCAPISNTLPPGWTMLVGTWTSLISNVTMIRFGYDVGSTQTEQFGFDNICLDLICDPTPCDCCIDTLKKSWK